MKLKRRTIRNIYEKIPNGALLGIYADEGISGTQVKKRESFLRMISDCENGKIDLILIKSVSRYARNIVDCISYIRILKSLGIAIYFEEQNINTLTEDSETYIGIYGVLAQAESENISANIKWGIRKRMESGSYNCNFNLLGYRRDKLTKEIVIIPEEAEAVRKIYSLYIQGNTLEQIKEYLESRQIKTSRGKYEWSKAGIKAILTNEKYVGDILYQKSFHPNLISKKVIRNCGEMDRYMVSNNHPAIIDRETAWLAKKEMSKRSSKRRSSENCITEHWKIQRQIRIKLSCYSAEYAAARSDGKHGQETALKRYTGAVFIIWKKATTPARSQKELKNTYYTLPYAAGLQKAFRVKTTCETRLKRCLPIPCRIIGCCLNISRLKI